MARSTSYNSNVRRSINAAMSEYPSLSPVSCTLSVTCRPSRTPYSSLSRCAANPCEPAASGNDSALVVVSTLPFSLVDVFTTRDIFSSINVQTSP